MVHDEDWRHLLRTDTDDDSIDLEIILHEMEPTVAYGNCIHFRVVIVIDFSLQGVGSLRTLRTLDSSPSGLSDIVPQSVQGVKRHWEEEISPDEELSSDSLFPPQKKLKRRGREPSNEQLGRPSDTDGDSSIDERLSASFDLAYEQPSMSSDSSSAWDPEILHRPPFGDL